MSTALMSSVKSILILLILRNTIKKKKELFFVAICDDTIVGTIAYNILDQQSIVLKRMFVKKEYRRNGVAQKLFNRLYQQLSFGQTIYLSTKENMALAAKAFYLRNQFTVITKNELPDQFPFFYEDDFFMKKSIE